MRKCELSGAGNLQLFCRKFPAENEQAVLLIIHGMAEHSARYEEFGQWMASAGITVVAFDLRGHGQTAGSLGNLGHFADKDGWNVVLKDTRQVIAQVKEDYPEKPVFILGHSMGSLIARSLLKQPLQGIDGMVLSGTTHHPGMMNNLGLALAKGAGKLFGMQKHSHIHNHLTFGSFNKPFKKEQSNFAWLSRDRDKVQEYEDDIYCGCLATYGFYRDLLTGLSRLYKNADAPSNKNLPLFFIAGQDDPVGNFGDDVDKVYEWYQKAGYKAVKLVFYPRARHEILNEINRTEVYRDILEWIQEVQQYPHK